MRQQLLEFAPLASLQHMLLRKVAYCRSYCSSLRSHKHNVRIYWLVGVPAYVVLNARRRLAYA